MRIQSHRCFHAMLVMVLFYGTVVAQTDYTPAELENFAKVYIAQKAIVTECDTMIEQWLSEMGLPVARYGEILRARIHGNEIILSDTEQAALEQLRAYRDQCKTHRETAIQSLCATHELDVDLYQEMHNFYQSQVAFQQQVQPFILEAMQHKKGFDE